MIASKSPIRLHEVAKMARVSVSTVSRAFNNDEKVNKKTMQRIMAIAQVLEGQGQKSRNRNRQSLSGNTIALVQPERDKVLGDTEINVCILENLQDIVEPVGGSIIPVRVKEYKEHSWMDCIRHAKGLIGYRLRDEDAGKFISAARTAGLPFVLLNRTDSDPTVPVCYTDHVQSGRMAAMHLLDLKHEHIGLIFSSFDIQSNQQRLQGIREVMLSRNIQMDPNCIVSDITTAEESGNAIEKLVRELGATAIITANDRIAKMVLSEALRRNISIPQDVSIISFDGTEEGAYMHPALTSVYTPWSEMARMAGQILLWMTQDQLLTQAKFVWSPRLIQRASTAALAVDEN